MVYVLGNQEWSSVLDKLLSDLLDLTRSDVVESDKDDLVVLVEQFEALLDRNLLLISGLY